MIFLALACTDEPAPLESTPDSDAFDLGPVQPCSAPVQLAYTESGEAWGLPAPEAPVAESLDGIGLVLADTADGHVLWTGFPFEPIRRVELDGSAQVERLSLSAELSLSAHDVDGDGDVELVVDDTLDGAPLGLPDGGDVRDVAWADLDQDGLLDAYIGRRGGDLTDLIRWGDGDVTEVAGSETDAAFSVHALDHDGDGDLDIAVINDSGEAPGSSRLWRDGRVDASAETGFDFEWPAMGGSFADFDGDGQRDLFVAAAVSNHLYRGGDGGLVEVAGVNQLSGDEMGWGSAWLDHDNDGQLDLLVAEGDLWHGDVGEDYEAPLELLAQDDGVFTDVSLELGLAQTGSHRAVLAHELNADGVLDLVVTGSQTRPLLYLSDGCTDGAWLEVLAPQHARVEVTTDGGVQTRWIDARPGFFVTAPESAWFGLGEAKVVEHVRVVELDGTVHELFGPLEARRTIGLP
ncbi:MAG: CRTAC1 family protein [Proteobacteria bacterium]|nr:CRTAC1 family protein [Pseudomonadota bacterium]MCP4919154.1 CRTAC1 family protein [Pseudomonadota bacterium]